MTDLATPPGLVESPGLPRIVAQVPVVAPAPVAVDATPDAAVDAGAGARRRAIADVAPIALSVAVFGVAIGATISAAAVDKLAALSGSLLVLAGSSQLTAVKLLDDGVAIGVVVATGLMINLRFVLYGAALARWFEDEPRWRRFLLAIPIVDQSFVLCQRRFETETESVWRRTYFVWVSIGLIVGFTSGQVAGLLLGTSMPDGARLQLAAPLALSGLVVLSCRRAEQVVALVASAVTVVVVTPVAGRSSMVVAVVVGIAAARTWKRVAR